MSPRKTRMTAVGLIAMPADRDERTVTADDIPSDPELRTAWADICALGAAAVERAWGDADWPSADAVEAAWNAAQQAAGDNDLAALRAALTRARDAATAAGLSTVHEDAAIAMLPGATS